MTQFFYGTTVKKSLIIARRGAIYSPLVGKHFSWLEELSNKDKEYYDELTEKKTIAQVAHELANTELATGKHEEDDYILLANSVSMAVVQALGVTKNAKPEELSALVKEPKIALGVNIDHLPARLAKWPETIYLDKLVDVRIYEKAMEHRTDIEKAFCKHTKSFYVVKNK